MAEAVILFSFGFILYTYAGYLGVLWIWGRFSKAPAPYSEDRPGISVVIAAFNEEDCIGETIDSILASNYPADRLEVIIVSDASTDRTDEVVRTFPTERVRLFRQSVRSGQTAGLQVGAQNARESLLLFADAGEFFESDTVYRLARHFTDPSVGAASGQKGVRGTHSTVAQGDGLFTRYDCLLRSLESRTGSSWVGCQGGLFVIRKALFQITFPLHIASDNALCYQLYDQGYQHRFDASARVLERPPQNLKNEFRRKIRIIVLQLHGLYHFRRLFNPLKHPAFFFQTLFHKVFRWIVPFALIALLAANAFSTQPWARILLEFQIAFYILAVIGYLSKSQNAPKILMVPAYFVTVNAAGLFAWVYLFRNFTIWQPPARESAKSR